MTAPGALEQRLGPFDGAAIIIANVIGGGILFLPPSVAAALPAPSAYLAVWLAGGVLAFCGASAYAELAALSPRAGGEYVYLREAYGSLAGFLTGWTSFIAGFAGAIATSAVVFAEYLNRFVPGASAFQRPVAITVVWLFALIHIRGVGPGRVIGNALTALKVTALILFVAAGFAAGAPTNPHPGTSPASPSGFLLALIPVMYSFSGWNAAAYMSEEVRDPSTNVPRALAIGTAVVTVIYILLNALYLRVLSLEELARVKGSVLDVVAERLLGPRAGDVMGIVALVGLAASINAMTFAGPRVYYAMARDGVFFASAAHVHSRWHTPAAAILAQSAWTTILILAGTAQSLASYVGFALTLSCGVAVSAVFVRRRRAPHSPRPYRTLGYPLTTAAFVAASAAMVANAIASDIWGSAIGLALIASGIPLHAWFRSRAPSTSPAA